MAYTIPTEEEIENHRNEVYKHKNLVFSAGVDMMNEFHKRLTLHDDSKINDPKECRWFSVHTPRLEKLTYGTQEYFDQLKDEDGEDVMDRHRKNNRHHPEFHDKGIDDMNLVDIMEMLCDWIAACKRHEDGDIMKSLSVNLKRFNIDPQLVNILRNTIKDFS
jgi:hypothetical protein